MTQHIVVGVYDAEADAAAAVRDLEAASIPTDAISQHSKANFGGTDFDSANAITHKKGFWGRLFSTTGDEDSDIYNRSIERGSTVVTVSAGEADVERVSEILESHSPINVSEESSEELPSEASAADAQITGMEDTSRVRRYIVQTIDHPEPPQK